MKKFNDYFYYVGRTKVFTNCIDGNCNAMPNEKFDEWCKRAITNFPDNMTYNEFTAEYLKELIALYKIGGGKLDA